MPCDSWHFKGELFVATIETQGIALHYRTCGDRTMRAGVFAADHGRHALN
jgi:hypothetical protein